MAAPVSIIVLPDSSSAWASRLPAARGWPGPVSIRALEVGQSLMRRGSDHSPVTVQGGRHISPESMSPDSLSAILRTCSLLVRSAHEVPKHLPRLEVGAVDKCAPHPPGQQHPVRLLEKGAQLRLGHLGPRDGLIP